MKEKSLARGLKYWSVDFHEYVTYLGIGVYKKQDGTEVKLEPKHVRWMSDQDLSVCWALADAAKMEWFMPDLDLKENEEYNEGEDGRENLYNAIRDLSEGLIDQNFKECKAPRAKSRFNKILRNMGLPVV